MRATHAGPSVASYREAVTQLVEANEPFVDIEAAIDEIPDLTEDKKATLWLLAFSLRDRAEQLRDARPHLAVVE